MDISDILASVSASDTSQRTSDLQALTRAWINERTAPELLPYPTLLIERCTQAVTSQIETIESLAGAMDPTSNFALVILQTELERFRFLLRSFLRARIAKVDRYPIHYRNLAASGPEGERAVLSPLESQYLTSHQALLASHYNASFLSGFPAPLQKLDDAGGNVSMVDKPDEDAAIFCRVLRDARVRGVFEDLDLSRGDIWVLRWSIVRERVRRGDVELI